MDTPESKGGAENDTQVDDPAFGPPAQQLSKQQTTNKGQQDKHVGGDIKSHVLELRRVGPDRLIELLLTAVIAFFAYVQLKTTTANYSSTTQQTNQLITAANTSASAADKNAAAAHSFALSAQGINHGIADTVSRLNLQAQATKDLAAAAGRQADRALAQANATQTLVAAAELANKTAGLRWRCRLNRGWELKGKRLL